MITTSVYRPLGPLEVLNCHFTKWQFSTYARRKYISMRDDSVAYILGENIAGAQFAQYIGSISNRTFETLAQH